MYIGVKIGEPYSSHTVHHLMVIGCEAPVTGLEVNLWNCGGSLAEAGLESPGTTCPGSKASQVRNIQKYLYNGKIFVQVLYMWSLDAAGLQFPAGVSLGVGGGSSIQHLVLQIHYVR